MQLLLPFDDPNVAVWQVERFAERYPMSEDEMTSKQFAFKHPTYGRIEFHLRFKPKQATDSVASDLYIEITNASSAFSISMKCHAWMENFDKTSSVEKIQKFAFNTNTKVKGWSPFLSSRQMSVFSQSSTVFICCRLPYAVELIDSISSKDSTLYRWSIPDFESPFNSAKFKTKWESEAFMIPQLKDVKLRLLLYPKGEKATSKDSCALYLRVEDLSGYSAVRLQFEFWIENTKSRFKKIGFEYVFLAVKAFGSHSVITQEELCAFARKGPLNICCNIRPIVDGLLLSDYTSIHSKIGLFFNDPFFSDAEIHVDNQIFKVSRLMLSVKSPVFRAMFDKETEEQKSGVVKIKGFEATMIKAMLVYIYKNEVKDVESIAAHLLPVADCYQVNSLVEKCSNSLVANLTVKNILSILELALERPHLENFRERVMKFAHRNFKEICKLTECDYFLTQHPEIAIKLLKLSHSIS